MTAGLVKVLNSVPQLNHSPPYSETLVPVTIGIPSWSVFTMPMFLGAFNASLVFELSSDGFSPAKNIRKCSPLISEYDGDASSVYISLSSLCL
jgi:hypothetical protein